jgi:pre-mRNA-processing factor SLU7
LDVNSAYYDPKTRSMRDNPNKEVDAKDLDYVGDNFIRYTGESQKMMEMQRFCWDANDKGVEISMQANPTQAELMNQGFREKKVDLKEKTKQSILEKYGGAEHLEAPPKELLYSQTERYVEYSRTGQLVKGQEQRLARSRYDEDGECLLCSVVQQEVVRVSTRFLPFLVYPTNHTSVWGSYWEDGRWGFACCHQFIKNSYCTGQAGIDARKHSDA